MSEHIISLQGITKEFDTKGGKVVALKDINLDIDKGDSYGIIGLSGAGKSTLVRTINLLEQPTEGKVLFDGNLLTGLKSRELNLHRRKISMIFQQFNLLMQRDAIGNICFPLELAGVPKAEARALKVLAENGIITLAEGATETATKTDIVDNPKGVEIVELEAATIPNSLPDLAFGVINANYAIGAEIMDKVVAVEGTDQAQEDTYVNVIVVNSDNAESEKTQALVAALQSDDVRAYIEETFNGAVIAKF